MKSEEEIKNLLKKTEDHFERLKSQRSDKISTGADIGNVIDSWVVTMRILTLKEVLKDD